MVLRTIDVTLTEKTAEKIIDVIGAINEKGEDISRKDINNLKKNWK